MQFPIWNKPYQIILIDTGVMSADGLLPGWFRRPWRSQPPPIVFLDEDGRVAEWDGLQADRLAEVTRWWSARRAPTASAPRTVSASATHGAG
jgi:hypothetical protein